MRGGRDFLKRKLPSPTPPSSKNFKKIRGFFILPIYYLFLIQKLLKEINARE